MVKISKVLSVDVDGNPKDTSSGYVIILEKTELDGEMFVVVKPKEIKKLITALQKAQLKLKNTAY